MRSKIISFYQTQNIGLVSDEKDVQHVQFLHKEWAGVNRCSYIYAPKHEILPILCKLSDYNCAILTM